MQVRHNIQLFPVFILFFSSIILHSQDIYQAIENGDFNQIQSLVTKDKAQVNLKDAEGDIPLCTSIMKHQKEISLLLIANGADIHNQNDDGLSPIHFAAIADEAEIVKALIEKGADLNSKTKSIQTPLIFASSRGNIKAVSVLVENGADIELSNDYGRTPLLTAARERGGIETVRILVEAGANVNARDIFDDTPLNLAAWRGFTEIVDYLLDHGAQFSISGEEGISLLRYASDKRLNNLYKVLMKKGGAEFAKKIRSYPVLHWAAAGGSVEIVDDLMKMGFQVDGADHFKWTPLHYAAYFGRIDAAKALIDKGAEINVKTPLRETPYYLARIEDESGTMDLLRTKGADLSLPGQTLLQGKYFGQKEPGQQLELFAPGIVSRLKGGHSNIVFTPDGKEAFWTEWKLTDVGYSGGCTIWHSKHTNDGWSLPEKFVDNGDTPFLSVDGNTLYLMAKLSSEGNPEERGIWYFNRNNKSFSLANLLNFDVEKTGLYWQFSLDKEKNLYFSTDDGLFRSLYKNGSYGDMENLASVFHPDYKGGSPFISPGGDYLIFSSRNLSDSWGSLDLYIGFKKPDGSWTRPVNMGPKINSAAIEMLPMVSLDGKYLFLRTERDEISGIYWISAEIIDGLRKQAGKEK